MPLTIEPFSCILWGSDEGTGGLRRTLVAGIFNAPISLDKALQYATVLWVLTTNPGLLC